MTRRQDQLRATVAAVQTIAAEMEEREAEAVAVAQYELRPRARHVSLGVLDLHRPPIVGGKPPRILQWQSNDPMLNNPQPAAVATLLRWDAQARVARYTLARTKAAGEIGALLELDSSRPCGTPSMSGPGRSESSWSWIRPTPHPMSEP